jgi:hypothetical protein
MHIQYNVKGDDFFAFQWYTLARSRIFLILKILCALTVSILCLFFVYSFFIQTWHAVLPALVLGALVFLFLPPVYRFFLRKSILASYRKRDTTTLFGMKTMDLDKEGFSENSNYNHYHMKWEDVDNVTETPLHFFIYMKSQNAFIVPKQAIGNNKALHEFRTILRKSLLPDADYREDISGM